MSVAVVIVRVPVQLELFLAATVEEDMAYLLSWAERYGYPELEFLLPEDRPYQFRDWTTAIFPQGELAWRHTCANIYAPEWLHCAVEAVRKGERR
jgi:hypothetical protein